MDKNKVIKNKKEAIYKLNGLLENYINKETEESLKKANLISYWIKDFSRMVSFEKEFDPKKNISYTRGDIVKVNFGFRIGSEHGGLHYAIILDIKNAHSSPIITVIPLSSIKKTTKFTKYNINLGDELYRLLKLKTDELDKKVTSELKDLKEEMNLFKNFLYIKRNAEIDSPVNGEDHFISLIKMKIDECEKALKENSKEQKELVKLKNEVSKMSKGSVALVNQITAISKLRIYDPKTKKDPLSGIRLSSESLDSVDKAITNLFININNNNNK